MIACINPNDQFLEENISTLTYATKASFITNQPVINDDPRNKLINQLKKQVKQLNEELGKANQHIELMSNLNNELNSTQREPSVRMSKTNNSFTSGKSQSG
jgi:TolA-binding protein